jgi:hypothetical protein
LFDIARLPTGSGTLRIDRIRAIANLITTEIVSSQTELRNLLRDKAG